MSDGLTLIIGIKTIHGEIRMDTKYAMFLLRPGPAVGFSLYEAFYQSHRKGKPIKRGYHIPRWKLVARFTEMPNCQIGQRVPAILDNGEFPPIKKRKI